MACLTAVELALLPLLLHQRSLDLADFIDEIPLGYRLARTPKQFLVGFDAPGEVISGDRGGRWSSLLAFWFVWSRGDDRERRAALVGLAVGGTLLVTTALLALVGVDYFDTRNVLVAWPPLALAVAAGLGARRAGRAGRGRGAAARRAGRVRPSCSSTTTRSLQRDDWRGVADALDDDHPLSRARSWSLRSRRRRRSPCTRRSGS